MKSSNGPRNDAEKQKRDAAARAIARHCVAHLPLDPKERIAMYRGLSLIMPTGQEAMEAERIAWTYEEAETYQLKFQRMLDETAK